MTEKSIEFEQLNTRIERMVHGKDATVEWNAKIPDPDDPTTTRQIDVLIKTTDGRKISVECRDRGGAQSVMWIEELAGRKQSLGLDAMIAVSTNGFTPLAAKKAARFGIVLYDFNKLDDDEIVSWSGVASVRTSFLVFSRLDIIAIMPPGSERVMSLEPSFTRGRHDGYHAVMAFIREQVGVGPFPAAGDTWFSTDGFLVGGVTPALLGCDYTVDVVDIAAECTSVVMRDHPDRPAIIRDVSVQRFDQTVSEVISHKGDLHVTIDTDHIKSPPNSLVHNIEMHFPESIRLDRYEFIGKLIRTSATTQRLNVLVAPQGFELPDPSVDRHTL